MDVKSRRTNLRISGYAPDEAGMETAGMRKNADVLIYFRKSELIKRHKMSPTPIGSLMADGTVGIECIKSTKSRKSDGLPNQERKCSGSWR